MEQTLEARIAALELGNVGLPSAASFTQQVPVARNNISQSRTNALNKGRDRILEVSISEPAAASRLSSSSGAGDPRRAAVYFVIAPTPIDEYKTPHGAAVSKSVRDLECKEQFFDVVNPNVSERQCSTASTSKSGHRSQVSK